MLIKIMEEIFEKLGVPKEEYFMTGSRALSDLELNYCVHNNDSDIDYVLNIHFRHILIEYLTDNKIELDFSCYNGGFKFRIGNYQYNIITCIDIEFMAWREALSILQHLIKTSELYRRAIKDKYVRYTIYEQLRGICKSTITYGNILQGE